MLAVLHMVHLSQTNESLLQQDPELSKFMVKYRINEFRGTGGVRIEDDVIVKEDGVEVGMFRTRL